MSPAECARRARILRISNAELARRCALDKNTVGNFLLGRTDACLSTLDKIDKALLVAELETLRGLAARHPAVASEAAVAAMCPDRRRAA